MEGRARKETTAERWAWVIPMWAGVPASIFADATNAPRTSYFLTGIAAGVAWQWWYRRDLTSRLTFISAVAAIAVTFNLVAREAFHWEDMNTLGLAWIGILIGLVHTEQYRRWQDRKAVRQAAEPARVHQGM